MNKVLALGMWAGMCVLSLSGCSTHAKTHWVTNQTVQPSALPNSVVQFVDKAGSAVGDSHPKVVSVTTDYDVTQKPMYRIDITGNFTYGTHHATQLAMIVLADGSAGAFVDPKDDAFNHINLNK